MQCDLAAVWAEIVPTLTRLVRAMSLDGACGDDVLQDVYIQAHQRCPDGLEQDEVRRWIFRVTVNRCHLEHRRRGQRKRAYERLAERTRDTADPRQPADPLERDESIELVHKQLLDLDPQLHTLLVLRYFVQLDSKEIGAILDVPDSTIRSRLRRARLQLAQRLIEAGYEHGD